MHSHVAARIVRMVRTVSCHNVRVRDEKPRTPAIHKASGVFPHRRATVVAVQLSAGMSDFQDAAT